MKYDTPFASRFKALREKMNVSQNEMAEKLGISQQSVSFYEKGERLPDYYVLNKICIETGCSIRYLFGYQESMSDYNEDLRKDLGLSDESMHYIRILPNEEKEILESLFNSTAFTALLSIIRYTFSMADSCAEPVSKSFEWDRGAFMCSRIFDDVMDEQYDKMLSRLSSKERTQYNDAIEKASFERRNKGMWEKKVKLPIVQFEKDPSDYLAKFKHFRMLMQ